ncbi:YybH family protein [Antarctobacter sp.]|uniref:YybH family protein n=1 Tax=Antarctobacter sp. TaxID=1872577 RepID=UPI003A5C57C3
MHTPTDLPACPEDFPKAFIATWDKRDGDAIAALFTEDADFVNVTGLWWHGRKAIAKPHDYALKSFFSRSSLRAGRTEVRHLSPDIAVVRCRFTLSGQITPDGTDAGDRRTILTFVVQRRADGWRAVSAQNTDVVPGMETHVNTGDLNAVDYRDHQSGPDT